MNNLFNHPMLGFARYLLSIILYYTLGMTGMIAVIDYFFDGNGFQMPGAFYMSITIGLFALYEQREIVKEKFKEAKKRSQPSMEEKA